MMDYIEISGQRPWIGRAAILDLLQRDEKLLIGEHWYVIEHPAREQRIRTPFWAHRDSLVEALAAWRKSELAS